MAFHARLCGLHHAAGLLGLQLYAAEWFGPVRVREYRGRMAGHAPGRFGFAGIRAGRIPVSYTHLEASPWGVLSVLLIFLVGAVLYFGVLPRMLKKEGAGK